MPKKKRKQLDLSELNVETLMAESEKDAVELGLLEASKVKPKTVKRIFRKEAVYVSR